MATKCGHPTLIEGEVSAFGETTTTHMPLNKEGSTDWCLDCIGRMAIRCGWCGESIFIGDPITLYTPRNPDFQQAEGGVIFCEDPKQVVGCLRMRCAETGADRAGFWVPGNDGKGTVDRVPSPLELSMMSGKAIFVSDIGSHNDAVKQANDVLKRMKAADDKA